MRVLDTALKNKSLARSISLQTGVPEQARTRAGCATGVEGPRLNLDVEMERALAKTTALST